MTPCWLWKASRQNKGYGQLMRHVNGKRKIHLAHRFIYELLVGPIASGMELNHICHQRGCVNPDHLEVVSHRDNMRAKGSNSGRSLRLVNAMASARRHCPQGHIFTEANTGRKRDGSRRCRACDREYAASRRVVA